MHDIQLSNETKFDFKSFNDEYAQYELLMKYVKVICIIELTEQVPDRKYGVRC